MPGLSPSSFFIFMGLYQPMTAGIADMNMGVLVPMALGIGICVAALVKLMNKMLRDHYSVLMHGIFGFVLASTVCIIPLEGGSVLEVLGYCGCFVVGGVVALAMSKYSERLNAN